MVEVERQLFSLAGWMTSELIPKNSEVQSEKVAFGGYLVRNRLDYSFTGQLIDIYGPSQIKGIINEIDFNFVKIYKDGPSFDAVINYNFQRNGRGVWVGAYELSQGPDRLKGLSTCSTELIGQSADQINSPHFDENHLRIVQEFANPKLNLLDRIANDDALRVLRKQARGQTS